MDAEPSPTDEGIAIFLFPAFLLAKLRKIETGVFRFGFPELCQYCCTVLFR